LIIEECPDAIKELADMENLTGRKVAIDASMALYQFMVAVRSAGEGQASMMLTNEAGEVTSHIQGMFNRTIKMMVSGIKPVYVFDGKAPQMKGGELAKRSARRAKAQADLESAKASENIEDQDKFSRRLVKVTRQHNLDCQELLKLMGVPFIVAPCEAEAQCAELAKKGKVYATATEDMDALTFRTPKLLRKLTFSQGKDKQPIVEIDMESVLRGLQLSYEQFVDLCILCGCDYCNTIKGIGPKTALRLVRSHGSLEQVINQLRREKKYEIPADWFPMRIAKEDLDSSKKEEEEEEEKEEVETENHEKSENKDVDILNVDGDEENKPSNIEDMTFPSLDSAVKTGGKDDEVELLSEPTVHSMQDTMTDTNNMADNGKIECAHESLQSVPIPVELEGVEYEDVPPLYQQARQLFLEAEVSPGEEVEFKWTAPDEAGLKEFLVGKMGFSAERVAAGIKRLQEAQQKKSQQRMDR
jgi:flap endonuclease-1